MHKNIVLLDLGNLGSEQTMKKTHSHVAFNAFSPIFSHFYYTKIKSNQFIVTIIKVATPAFIVLLASSVFQCSKMYYTAHSWITEELT